MHLTCEPYSFAKHGKVKSTIPACSALCLLGRDLSLSLSLWSSAFHLYVVTACQICEAKLFRGQGNQVGTSSLDMSGVPTRPGFPHSPMGRKCPRLKALLEC